MCSSLPTSTTNYFYLILRNYEYLFSKSTRINFLLLLRIFLEICTTIILKYL